MRAALALSRGASAALRARAITGRRVAAAVQSSRARVGVCAAAAVAVSRRLSTAAVPSAAKAHAAAAPAAAAPAAATPGAASSSTVSGVVFNNERITNPSSIPTEQPLVTFRDVAEAYERIRHTVVRTPLDHSPRLSQLAGCQLYLKKEHISITGSYKERGALNKLLTLTAEEKARGVICWSAGNHAQAVSYHATRLGIDGVIVMPITTPFVKVAATRQFGAKVVLAGQSFGGAAEHAMALAKKEGRTIVHAFNDPKITAGAGTVAMELLEQNPFLDAVVVPIGGGGLIAGMAAALKHVNPRIKVYGVEASAMPGMKVSVEQRRVVAVPKQPTMADGIAVERVGEVPYSVVRRYVDDIVTVDEIDIAGAVLKLLEIEKTVLEGSGAAALAAVLAKDSALAKSLAGQNVCIICSGGNIDMTVLGRIIEKGLVKDGRMARIRVTVGDTPGELAKITDVCARLRANVRDIEHERAFLLENVGVTQPVLTLETKGFEHVKEVVDALNAAGLKNVQLETPHS